MYRYNKAFFRRMRGHYGTPYQNYDYSSVPLFILRFRRSKGISKQDDASDAPE